MMTMLLLMMMMMITSFAVSCKSWIGLCFGKEVRQLSSLQTFPFHQNEYDGSEDDDGNDDDDNDDGNDDDDDDDNCND